MASRLHRDRDDHRKGGHKDSSKSGKSAMPPLDEFWISGLDIDRQVLQSSICRFLGAEATCRPHEHNGVPGYKIRALRQFTPDMIVDLKQLSRDFIQENSRNVSRNLQAVPYSESMTRRGREPDDATMDYEPSYSGRGPSYSQGQPSGGYSASYQPPSGSYSQASYSGQPSYGQVYTGPPGSGGIPAYSDHQGFQPAGYSHTNIREVAPQQQYGGHPSGYSSGRPDPYNVVQGGYQGQQPPRTFDQPTGGQYYGGHDPMSGQSGYGRAERGPGSSPYGDSYGRGAQDQNPYGHAPVRKR